MQAHLLEWLALLVRWGHIIHGIAWIGASFYFNWLENNLERRNPPEGYAGDLWAVHGGGFYYLRKLAGAPAQLPEKLHWFKWEAYATWISGFMLLWLVYYWNAGTFMLEAGQTALAPWQAVALGISSLLISWLVYDGLCKWIPKAQPVLLAVSIMAWFVLLAYVLGLLLSPRAMYMHVGAAIGTVMVGNVFRVIIPAQQDMVQAVTERRQADLDKARHALQRSRHNNYFTLPVLFIMVSAHFPATWSHPQAWAVLLGISLAGAGIRHWFNIRHAGAGGSAWIYASLVLLAAMVLWTAPTRPMPSVDVSGEPVSMAEALAVVQTRCASCHARKPVQAGFATAPMGVALETEADLLQHAERVDRAVLTRSMPLANLTRMTDEERNLLYRWYRQHGTGATVTGVEGNE